MEGGASFDADVLVACFAAVVCDGTASMQCQITCMHGGRVVGEREERVVSGWDRVRVTTDA